MRKRPSRTSRAPRDWKRPHCPRRIGDSQCGPPQRARGPAPGGREYRLLLLSSRIRRSGPRATSPPGPARAYVTSSVPPGRGRQCTRVLPLPSDVCRLVRLNLCSDTLYLTCGPGDGQAAAFPRWVRPCRGLFRVAGFALTDHTPLSWTLSAIPLMLLACSSSEDRCTCRTRSERLGDWSA